MMITVMQGDLVKQSVDAIVNAARPSLLGGGGVDGAVHRAAGSDLYEECFDIPLIPDRLVDASTRSIVRSVEGASAPHTGVRCLVAHARATRGHGLSADWIIHTVGPIYDPTFFAECYDELETAYVQSLLLAQMLGCRTVALPAVSCGTFGYPPNEAAAIAIEVASRPCWHFEEIRFVLFPDDVFKAFEKALADLSAPKDEDQIPW